jgi:UDP-N-acetylmuramoyl-tripeptide--D-alanyl-D-alanine ligase
VGRPTVGVVTRVAGAHTELVGDIDGVARAKSEIVQALPSNGCAVLNADDHRVAAMASLTDARVLTFGCDGGDVRVEQLVLDELARPSFVLATPWGRTAVRLAVSGVHMAVNAAAAAAAALAVDVPLDAIGGALATATLSPWRMEMQRTTSGGWLLNDAYNANPTSVRAALETLAALPVSHRVAVLGYMAELDDPVSEHRAIAAEVEAAGIVLIAVGTDLYGIPPVADPAAVVGAIGPDRAVLVKASRMAGLERVAALLSDA